MSKCKYLGRLVSSYRFSGFVCKGQSVPQTIGQLQEWSKDQRTSYMEKNGCYRDGCGCWLLTILKENVK